MKRYRLTRYFKTSYTIDVNGVNHEVTFEGGMRQPKFIPGYFMTANKDLQKALENTHMFNVDFVLEFDSDKIEQVIINQKPIDNTTFTNIADVVTWAQGASYFRKEYPDLYDKSMKKVDVLSAMVKHNVKFPNWEQK